MCSCRPFRAPEPTPVPGSLRCSVITSWEVGVYKWLLDPAGQGLAPHTLVLPSARRRPAPTPQLVIKSTCFSLLCQLHPRPAGPADRTGPPAPPLSRPLPSLLPVGSPSDLSEMQIRGCHFLLKSRKQPPILIKRKPKLLTTANKALHALALSTASLPLPS